VIVWEFTTKEIEPAEELTQVFPYDVLSEALAAYHRTDDVYVMHAGYSFLLFAKQIKRWIKAARQHAQEAATPEAKERAYIEEIRRREGPWHPEEELRQRVEQRFDQLPENERVRRLKIAKHTLRANHPVAFRLPASEIERRIKTQAILDFRVELRKVSGKKGTRLLAGLRRIRHSLLRAREDKCCGEAERTPRSVSDKTCHTRNCSRRF
jgi:hypothetical protein